MTNEILTAAQLDQVAGGTFDPNKYSEEEYNQAGLRTEYHFFDKDEFWAKDKKGQYQKITYDQANWAVNYFQHHQKRPSYELIIKES